MLTVRALAMAFVGTLFGCSSSAGLDLSPGTVSNLPAGTGTGSAASGTYSVTLNVTSCSGACTTTEFGLTVPLCTVGPAGTATFALTQMGGRLTAQASGSSTLYVTSFAGGINADGSFDIGGVATNVQGQPVTVSSRADGTIKGTAVNATVEALGTGTVNGSAISCTQTLTAIGSRTGG
jgi:hypothetical protein